MATADSCPCGCTVLAERLAALERVMDEKFARRDEAIVVATRVQAKSDEDRNHLIAQMREQAQYFASRTEMKLQLQSIEGRLNTLETFRDKHAGERKGHEPIVAIGLLVVAAAISAAIALFVGGA